MSKLAIPDHAMHHLGPAEAQRLTSLAAAMSACYPARDMRSRILAQSAVAHLGRWCCPADWLAAGLLLAAPAAVGELAATVQAAAGVSATALAVRYQQLETQALRLADMWRKEVAPPYRRLQKLFVASYLDEPLAFLGMAALLAQIDYLEAAPVLDAAQIAGNLQTVLLPMLERYGLWHDRKQAAERLVALASPGAAREVAGLIQEYDGRRQDVLEQVRAGLAGLLGPSAAEVELAVHQVRASRVLEESQAAELQRIPTDPEQVLRTMAGRLAIDVRVATSEMCYRVLGALHRLGRFAPGAMRDYLSAPRFNAYRMLHTRVRLGAHGEGPTVDFFIGSAAEAAGNEYGRAAEWMAPGVAPLPGWWHSADRERRALEAQRDALRATHSLIFTPLGELHVLPLHSTPLDFAFKVHTDLGDFYTQARINGAEARHGDRLATLDIVAVYFDPRLPAQLRPEWMAAITTPAASAGIKKQVRYRESSAAHGKALLQQSLEAHFKRLGIALSDARLRGYLDDAVRRTHAGDRETLFIQIARGTRSAEGIALRLVALEAAHLIRYEDGRPLDVRRERVRMAGCCQPALETPIVGRLSQSGGAHASIKVHAAACPNVGGRTGLVGLAWHEPDYQGLYEYVALGSDREGLLQDVLAPFYAGSHYLHKVVAERLDDCTAQFQVIAETGAAAVARTLEHQLEAIADIHEVSGRPFVVAPADLTGRRIVLQQANPYPYNEPVYRGGEFVGRARELAAVREYLARRCVAAPMIVHGPWRIGKTSLLRHIQEYDTQHFAGLAAYVNCQAIPHLDVGAFAETIAEAVGQRLQKETDRLGAHPLQLSPEERQRLLEDPVGQLHRYLAQVNARLNDSRGLRLIVLIDEFSDIHDLVAARQLSPRVFGLLRELLTGPTNTAFILAVQAQVLAQMRVEPEHGSGLFEIATLCPVGPLELESLRRLLVSRAKSVGLSWDEAAAARLIGLTGANPYVLNLLAHEAVRIVADTGEQVLLPGHVQAAVETILAQGRNGDLYFGHLATLAKTPGERMLLARLAQGDALTWRTEDALLLASPPAWRAEQRECLIHLAEKGLVGRQRAGSASWMLRLSIPLMADWIAAGGFAHLAGQEEETHGA